MMWLAEHWNQILPLLMAISFLGILLTSFLYFSGINKNKQSVSMLSGQEIEDALEHFIEGAEPTGKGSFFYQKLQTEFERFKQMERGQS